MNQWRVKLTISNYNFNRNYSNWNVLIQHPGFNKKATTYSFNSTKLSTLGIQGNFLQSIQRTLILCLVVFFVFAFQLVGEKTDNSEFKREVKKV
jgi:hypothetical protein